MPVNKIIYAGETLVDLTEDSVTPETLAKGVTAHDKTGAKIVGTYEAEDLSEVLTEQEGLIADLQEALQGKGSMWYDAFWDAYQDFGNRTSYQGAFSGRGWTEKTFKPKYPVKLTGITTADNMFAYFNMVSTNQNHVYLFDFAPFNDWFDFSGVQRLESTFQNSRIKNIYVDASNATRLHSTFGSGNGGAMQSITLRVTDKCTVFTNLIAYQYELSEFYVTEDSVIAASINTKHSSKLSKTSIIGIINVLSDTTTGQTLTFSKTAVNKAFATAEGGTDGSTSEEWLALVGSKPNWSFSLS